MRQAVRLLLAVAMVSAMPAALASFTSTTSASHSVDTAPDWLPPTVDRTVIAKATGYLSGYVKQGGAYHVYANITETGNPPSGMTGTPPGTVVANLNAITTGQTTVSLVSTSGPWTVEGQSYNYRASLTASNPLSAGAKTYTIAATDHGGHTTPNPLPTYSVTVDNTAPTATGISTGNASGGNHGTAEIGDTITFTFSERIDPYSIVSGWVGTSSTNVVVELIDGGCGVLLCTNDSFKIYNSAYSATLPFGTINLGSGGYYGCAGLGLLCLKDPTAFGASGTPSTMVQSTNTITITLGTRSGGNGSVNDVGGNTDMSWDSTTTPYDAAGNSASGNTYTEGDNDYEF